MVFGSTIGDTVKNRSMTDNFHFTFSLKNYSTFPSKMFREDCEAYFIYK